jgi:hypothetical protein
MKSIFGSYKYEDKEWKDKVEKWGKEDRLGKNVRITGESKDVRAGGANAVKKHLSPKVGGASDMLVFVGDNTHNAKGVEYEIQNAKSSGKRVIPVRIPGTTGAAPKSIRDQEIVAFEPSAIEKALKK